MLTGGRSKEGTSEICTSKISVYAPANGSGNLSPAVVRASQRPTNQAMFSRIGGRANGSSKKEDMATNAVCLTLSVALANPARQGAVVRKER